MLLSSSSIIVSLVLVIIVTFVVVVVVVVGPTVRSWVLFTSWVMYTGQGLGQPVQIKAGGFLFKVLCFELSIVILICAAC